VGFATSSTSPALAGAWTLPPGAGQVIVTGTFLSADHYYDSKGRVIHGPSYQKFEAPAFIEYGFTDRFTGIVSPSLLATIVGNGSGGQYAGLGYTEFGGRFRLFASESWVVSAQATARLPGSTNRFNPAEACCTAKEFDLRLLVGKSFALGSWPAFVDGQAAYRLRSGELADEIRLDLTLGVRPFPDWLVLLQSFNVLANDPNAGLFTGTRYHKVQLGVVWDFAHNWSVELAGVATIAGRNAPVESGIITGLWYRF
jgi:hypothetical protein